MAAERVILAVLSSLALAALARALAVLSQRAADPLRNPGNLLENPQDLHSSTAFGCLAERQSRM